MDFIHKRKKRDTYIKSSYYGYFFTLFCYIAFFQGQNLHSHTYYSKCCMLQGEYTVSCILYVRFLIRWDLSDSICPQITKLRPVIFPLWLKSNQFFKRWKLSELNQCLGMLRFATFWICYQFHMKDHKNSNWRNWSLKKSGLKMLWNKTLIMLNVIYVNLFICLVNVLHIVWKCQK